MLGTAFLFLKNPTNTHFVTNVIEMSPKRRKAKLSFNLNLRQ